MTHPKITKSLKGALGETYYKELCSQRGWAYCSLENLYGCKDLGSVVFKMGFERIRVHIPKHIRPEIIQISKPSNHSSHNPSFVFDYLACKIEQADISQIQHPKNFCWAEVKTGLGIFSDNQYKTLSDIRLPIAVFHIENILSKPEYIDMDWDMMSGSSFAHTLTDVVDDEDDYNDSHSKSYDNSHSNYSNGYRNNYNNKYSRQYGGIMAKFSSVCKICKRKITAGKDRVAQDRYSNWIHVRCASQKRF